MADIFDFYVYDDRSIQFAIAEPIMLEDKDVTQFRFRIPKVLNNIDMTDWEWWFIFVNAKKVKYTTQLTLTDDEDDPDNFSVATYTVGYGFSGYVGSVSFSIEALNVSGEEIVNEWHTKTYSTAVIDTLQGLRAIIPEPDGQVSTGITEEVKQALLQIARKVAYIDEHGQTYYNALYDALYAIIAVTVSPRSISLSAIGQTSQLTAQTTPAGGTITWSTSNASVATVSANGLVTATGLGSATITATSGGKSGTCSMLVAEATLEDISAVYTPSGTVYESDSLDILKSRLVVTAHWSNGTTSEVASADYTLSGTLTMGSSTVTVSYGGMTTTFEVTVVGLTGITATYTQSGTVYDSDSLNSLKSDLVVMATYSDSSTAVIDSADYTLGGTLAEGTSTITVFYGGKTDTFNVTVTHFVPIDYTLDALENVTWYDNYKYNNSNGTMIASNGEHCTSKFTVQDTIYVITDTSNACEYFCYYIWDGQDNFLGCTEFDSKKGTYVQIQLKPEYKYAIKAYKASNFDSSNISMLPVDKRDVSKYNKFSIKLADYTDQITQNGKKGELYVTDIFDSLGIAYDTFISRTAKSSCITLLGDVSPSFNVFCIGYIVWNSKPMLRIANNSVSSFSDLISYIENNDVTIVFNGG